jgi:hypothetical protein
VACGFTFEHYQEALKNGRIVGLRCKGCGSVIFPPRGLCTECGSQELEEKHLTGEGVIQTFTVIRVPPEGMKSPYIIAMVEFKEGPWAVGRLVGVDTQTADLGLIGKEVKAGSEPFFGEAISSGGYRVLTFGLRP